MRSLADRLMAFIKLLDDLKEGPDNSRIKSITKLGRHDKGCQPEKLKLSVRPSEVNCILGPTGSGKSRFPADIEWMAQGDTPTGQCILVNGKVPDPGQRFSIVNKLVSQFRRT
jgi:ABC-type lipoprotein export system ATPase subunit